MSVIKDKIKKKYIETLHKTERITMSANDCMRRDSFSPHLSSCSACVTALFVCLLECVIVYVPTIILVQVQQFARLEHSSLHFMPHLASRDQCTLSGLPAMQMTAASANNIYLLALAAGVPPSGWKTAVAVERSVCWRASCPILSWVCEWRGDDFKLDRRFLTGRWLKRGWKMSVTYISELWFSSYKESNYSHREAPQIYFSH